MRGFTVIGVAFKLGAAVLILPIIAVHLCLWILPWGTSLLGSGFMGIFYGALVVGPVASISVLLWLTGIWFTRNPENDPLFLVTKDLYEIVFSVLYVIAPFIACVLYVYDRRSFQDNTVFFTSGAYVSVYGVDWMVFANMIPLIAIGVWAIVMMQHAANDDSLPEENINQKKRT